MVSSADAGQAARNAVRFGAVGFLGKDAGLVAIEQAIADALDGRRIDAPTDEEIDPVAAQIASLTPTQLKVLLGVMQGRLNKQIAYDLGISEATVKAHMTAILKKLDVQNRTQAVLAAKALGLETISHEILFCGNLACIDVQPYFQIGCARRVLENRQRPAPDASHIRSPRAVTSAYRASGYCLRNAAISHNPSSLFPRLKSISATSKIPMRQALRRGGGSSDLVPRWRT